ncbi:hypothetical protein BOX15_Mlig011580g1 [Macrostomum lignano]|uniref:Uncharacterized protein n=1 Tax=Macrostomum lignano TaxID=282301 RepID=A0A267FC64_9PLAT|nr:hypothetical protein BOX15_Mlig011580g1 [Macrostomum lignano]
MSSQQARSARPVAKDSFRFFYYKGESEESKAMLRRMVGASARVLVQPSISCVITNPDLMERVRESDQKGNVRSSG